VPPGRHIPPNQATNFLRERGTKMTLTKEELDLIQNNVGRCNMRYYEIVEDGTVGRQAQKILDLLFKSNPLSLREIKDKTEIEINAVSGRVNDLKKRGKVIECNKRKCSISGRMITPVSTP